MLKEVQGGDVVVVVRLDRLARSVRDLLNILERFSQDDVGFVSLREKHIDTTSAGGRLVLNIMAKRASSRPARSASAPRSIASATCRNRIERSRQRYRQYTAWP